MSCLNETKRNKTTARKQLMRKLYDIYFSTRKTLKSFFILLSSKEKYHRLGETKHFI